MTNIIKFPSKCDRDERELDDLMRLIKAPNGVDPEQWERIAIPELRKYFRIPPATISFNAGAMTVEEVVQFEKELTGFVKEYSFEVIKPAIIQIAKLYAQILRNS